MIPRPLRRLINRFRRWLRPEIEREPIRGRFRFNPETQKLEPFGETRRPQAHNILTDTIAPTESYATAEGRVFDSRSALDRHYREHGYERCSKDELQKTPPKHEFNFREHKECWERAENDLRYGNVDLTEWEKEQCRRENRMLKEYQEGSRSDFLMEKLREQDPKVTTSR